MNKVECAKILAIELTGYSTLKIDENYILCWYGHFNNLEIREFQEYLHKAVSQCVDFPPTPGKVWQLIHKRRISKIPSEAEHALRLEAEIIASRRVPEIAGHMQFRSPEHMHEALYWQQKEHNKEAERAFQELKLKLFEKVGDGLSYSEAIKLLAPETSLPDNSKKVLNLIMGTKEVKSI